nr:hypothetical protein [uncultured Campylobacter sp.]
MCYLPCTVYLRYSSRGISFFDGLCLRYCRDGFVSFYGAEFRRDFATCEIWQGADSLCMRLVKFSGGALLEILSL